MLNLHELHAYALDRHQRLTREAEEYRLANQALAGATDDPRPSLSRLLRRLRRVVTARRLGETVEVGLEGNR